MKKTKTKLINYTAYAMALALGAILIGQGSQVFHDKCEDFFQRTFYKQYAYAYVEYKAPVKKEELTMKEWVKREVENAGLSWEEANCIITEESSWREDICIIEPDMSISCGLWMLNTVHNKGGLTNACKVDYRCATEWAIDKRLREGHWNAWTQWRNICK